MPRVAWAVPICLVVGACGSDNGQAAEASVAPLRVQCIEGETEFDPPANYGTSPPGAPTAVDALTPILEAAIASRGGEIVQLAEAQYAVSNDGRIVLISTASETRPNEWHLVGLSFCGRPDQVITGPSPPATEPPATKPSSSTTT